MSLCSCVFTHYVAETTTSGGVATALCGKVWVPTKDHTCHKRCPECEEILESIPAGWVA